MTRTEKEELQNSNENSDDSDGEAKRPDKTVCDFGQNFTHVALLPVVPAATSLLIIAGTLCDLSHCCRPEAGRGAPPPVTIVVLINKGPALRNPFRLFLLGIPAAF